MARLPSWHGKPRSSEELGAVERRNINNPVWYMIHGLILFQKTPGLLVTTPIGGISCWPAIRNVPPKCLFKAQLAPIDWLLVYSTKLLNVWIATTSAALWKDPHSEDFLSLVLLPHFRMCSRAFLTTVPFIQCLVLVLARRILFGGPRICCESFTTSVPPEIPVPISPTQG